MIKKTSAQKSIIYLFVLSVVLAFSLYNLFSEDARSWFAMNKQIILNPVYGRVLTSGAGRNLSSFKNNEEGDLDFVIVEEADADTATLRMVPGDTVHFVFLISVADTDIFENSSLVLSGVSGDASLRGDCIIKEGAIRIAAVTVTAETVTGDDEGDEKIRYEHSTEWQQLNNAALLSLYTDGTEISISIDAPGIEGTIAEAGGHEGNYVFLVDVPMLYRDTGEKQNSQKAEYDTEWNPLPDQEKGVLIIERCLIIREY